MKAVAAVLALAAALTLAGCAPQHESAPVGTEGVSDDETRAFDIACLEAGNAVDITIANRHICTFTPKETP